jgi:hypothetical protein
VSIKKTIKIFAAVDYYHTSQFSKVAVVLVNSYSVGNVKDDRKFNVSARINQMIVDDLYLFSSCYSISVFVIAKS